MGEITITVNNKGRYKVEKFIKATKSNLENIKKMKSIEKNISINELIKNAVMAYLKTN